MNMLYTIEISDDMKFQFNQIMQQSRTSENLINP
jgi:hypothetical protein